MYIWYVRETTPPFVPYFEHVDIHTYNFYLYLLVDNCDWFAHQNRMPKTVLSFSRRIRLIFFVLSFFQLKSLFLFHFNSMHMFYSYFICVFVSIFVLLFNCRDTQVHCIHTHTCKRQF